MFDLEQSIAEWRRQMLAAGIKSPVPLEELEIHLREEVEQQVKSGMSLPEAFCIATHRIGYSNALREEFNKSGGKFASLAAAPPQLQAYTIFAVAITFMVYFIVFIGPAFVRAWLVPYTGWLACMFYQSTILFAFMLIYSRQNRNIMRLLITLQLLLQIAFGVSDLFHTSGETSGNPYLTISPWRPVWTILIPMIWIAVLYSPRMNRFCSKKYTTQNV